MKELIMKRTKIILLNIMSDGEKVVEPLGLSSIAATLRESGFTTTIFSCCENDIPFDLIREIEPSIVGISLQYSTMKASFDLCEWLKTLPFSTIIAIGGYISTYYGNEVLQECRYIDFAIRGEGEYIFRDIAYAVENNTGINNVEGLSYIEGDKVKENPMREPIDDLDKLPFPSRDILSKYGIHLAQIEGGRGCTSACSFCSLHNFWTNDHYATCPSWRGKSVERIVDEIEHLYTGYNIRRFTFLDCSFENPDNDYGRIECIAKEILRREMKIYYYINVRATFHKIADQDFMDLLIHSGLSGIFLGVESFYEPDLRIFSKKSTVSDNIKAIESLSKFPINIDIGSINFHPYSTFEGLRKNAQYLKKYNYSKKVLFSSKLSAYKGTALYNKLIKDGLLQETTFKDANQIFPKYRFLDNRIGLLYDFIAEYIQNFGIDKQEKLNYYANDHLDILVYLKQEFRNTQGEQLIATYSELFKELNSEYVNKNYNCFIELLNLAENRWNTNDANAIINELLDYGYLNTYVNQLEMNRMKLFLSLSKINSHIINDLR